MSKKLPTICMVITQDHWGGAQRYVFDVVTNLAKDYNWIVAIGEVREEDKNTLSAQLYKFTAGHPEAHISIEPLQYLKRAISPLHDLQARTELVSLVKKHNVDLVHAHSSKAMAIVASIRKKIPKTATTIHGWVSTEPLSPLRKQFYKIIERYAARHLDVIIAPDSTSANIARSYGATHVLTIPHGIDQIAFLSTEDAKKQLHIPKDASPIVGAIANWYPTKNIPVLVEVFAELKKDFPKAHLVLIGEGPQRNQIEQIITQHNLRNSIFLPGALPNAAQLLRGFSIGVLPSLKEGFPYVALEMAQAGIPIVASNLPGIKEAIGDLPNTILTNPDHNSLHTALIQAIPLMNQPAAEQKLQIMIEQTQITYKQLLLQ